jgi:hypothetical protein
MMVLERMMMGRILEGKLETEPQAGVDAGVCWEEDAALAAALAAVLVEYRAELGRGGGAGGNAGPGERWRLVSCWEQLRGGR